MKLNLFELYCMNNPFRKFLMKHLELKWFQELLEKHEVDPTGKSILDIACGSGFSTKLLQKAYDPSLLVGFDLMPVQVELAHRDGKADFIFQANLLELSLADHSFDIGFGFGILHHVKDWKQGIAEVCRVIKPGGHLIMEEPNHLASEFFRKWVRFAIPKEGQFTWPEFLIEFEKAGMRLLGERKLILDPFKSFLWEKLEV